MARVSLTEAQRQAACDIADGIQAFMQAFHQRNDCAAANRIVAELAEKACALHMELKAEGHEPRFGRRICANRGVPPGTVEFYNHVHVLEDLLRFLADEHANDDPEDRTLDMTFALHASTGQYGGDKTYPIRRIRSGWELEWNGKTYRCDREGSPYLTRMLEADRIDFPQGLGGWLRWLWLQAQERGMTADEMQRALDDLAAWISGVNTSEPRSGVWEEMAGDGSSLSEGGDPPTADAEFSFRVFSRRWGHDDTYRLKLAEDGWRIESLEKAMRVCDGRGWPVLYQLFEHDSIDYPNHLGSKLQRLWEKARGGALGPGQVQQAIDALAGWVSETERSAPRGSIWEGYK